MKLQIHTAILGAGLSGAITQYKLNQLGHFQNFIVERGYSHGKATDNYVIYTKQPFDFSGETINVDFRSVSSGARPFKQEYIEKLYQRSISGIELHGGDAKDESFKGYEIDISKLFSDLRIYGNIEINHIDINKKVMHGIVLHLNKKVEIHYFVLINTIPIYEFAKLAGINLLEKFDLFISYFPIGIKTVRAATNADTMLLEYISDPNIPYYRKHTYKDNISYEYCLNKPFNERFSAVISPGKFIKIPDDQMDSFYDFCGGNGIYMVGRYATWNPDFILDHIIDSSSLYDNLLVGHINNLMEHYV